MNYRLFGNEKKISQLGFGAMRLPLLSDDQADIDIKKTEEMILHAYEQGVNYYDTAYVYHNGKSEIVLGDILKRNQIRDKVFIADKLPTFVLDDFDPDQLFQEQLERLSTDLIDFYLLHNLNGKKWEQLKSMGILEFMERTRNSGKIGAMGFSFHDDYDAFVRILDDYDWEFCQIQLNFMDIEYQAGLKGLEYAASKNIPIVIMEPLKGGQILTMQDPVIQELKERYQLESNSTAEISLNFLFDRPEILTVLSGMNHMDHVNENVQTASSIGPNEMPHNQKDFLSDLKKYIDSKEMIACTGCQYCVPGCPQHIQIPHLFEMYNNSIMYHSREQNHGMFMRFISQSYQENPCIACGQCEEVCPQGLKIIDLLETTISYLSEPV